MPKISVIVPIFNSEKYLSRCIHSVLRQTYEDLELILIDDGSTDCSSAICDDFANIDARVRVVHKENGGVSSARNLGMEIASGEWVTFVDSDDWIENSMYLDMYNMLLTENAEIAYCDICMDFHNSSCVWKAASYNAEKDVFLNNFISSEWTSLCNVLIRKSLLDDHNIKCPEGVPFCEDYHMATRLMYFAKKICYVPKPLYHYNRINDGSAVHNYSTTYYQKLRWVNVDMMNFFELEGTYEKYAKTLSWRLLHGEQELVLNENTYDEFLSLPNDVFKHIWSCPKINFKIKIMMWALSHHMRFVAKSLLMIRMLRLKFSRVN